METKSEFSAFAVTPAKGPVVLTDDSDWTRRDWRIGCYSVYTRTVRFTPATLDSAILFWAEEQKQGWYGQEFSYVILRLGSDRVLKMRRAVDSGD